MSDLDRVTVQRRVAQILSLLRDLAGAGDVTAARLEADRMLRHAVERILTQVVELATAINAHVAAAVVGRAPEDYRSSFALAAESGMISCQLADRLAPSAGLRNVLVHEYVDVDLQAVVDSIGIAISDYGSYCSEVASWLEELNSG